MSDQTANRLHREAEAARDLLNQIASDDDELNHDMVEGETSLLEAVSAALDAMDECDAIAAGCKDREAVFSERRRNAERRKENLRAMVQQALEVAGMDRIKVPTGTVTVKDVPPKPLITDESLIPAAYWRQADPVIDKKAIADAMKAEGASIPGVTMSNGGATIQIRRA